MDARGNKLSAWIPDQYLKKQKKILNLYNSGNFDFKKEREKIAK